MLTLLQQSTTEPLSLSEAKAHLRVDFSNDDTLISALITASRQLVESETDTCLVATQWLEELPYFHRHYVFQRHNYQNLWHRHDYKIKLTKYPVIFIDSIHYYDTDNNPIDWTNVAGSGTPITNYYDMLPSNSVGWIEPVTTYPVTFWRPDAVSITYTVQNTNNDELVKACMKLLIGNWYENREQEVIGFIPSSLQLGVDRLLSQIDRRGYQ